VPRITKVYTRGGDDGMTSLGSGQRVKKHAPRVEAYGTVDELSSQIGVALASGLTPELTRHLRRIQNELFHLGADLCFPEQEQGRRPGPRVEQSHVDALEALLDELTENLGPLENFILPGGSAGAAHLHLARTVCRRAERVLVDLADREPVSPLTIKYLNRLSDALFVMARHENRERSVPDVFWDSRA
jgi:cob(I)alamin adenosyltransferase